MHGSCRLAPARTALDLRDSVAAAWLRPHLESLADPHGTRTAVPVPEKFADILNEAWAIAR